MNLDALISTLGVVLVVVTLMLVGPPILEMLANIRDAFRQRSEHRKNLEWLNELIEKHPRPWSVERDALCDPDMDPRGPCWKVIDRDGTRVLPDLNLTVAAVVLAYSRDQSCWKSPTDPDLSSLSDVSAADRAA